MPSNAKSAVLLALLCLAACLAQAQVSRMPEMAKETYAQAASDFAQDTTFSKVCATFSSLPGAGEGWESLSDAEKAYKGGEYKTALHRLMQARTQFEKERDDVGLCLSQLKTALLYQHWQVFERALSYYQEAETKAAELHMPKPFMQLVWGRLARCAERINRNEDALLAYRSLLDSYPTGYSTGRRNTLKKLAELYLKQQDYEKALAYSKDLVELEVAQSHGLEGADAQNSTGIILSEMGRFQESIAYYAGALGYYGSNPALCQKKVASLIQIGAAENQLRLHDKALTTLNQALAEPCVQADAGLEADLRNFVALTYLNKGAHDRGLKYIDGAIAMAKKSTNRDILVRCYRTKALLCDNVLNYAEGSKFHQLYAQLKDTLRYEERLKEQSALLRDLNVERLEKELRLLITDTERNQLILKKSALEAEREIRQKELLLLQREKQVQDYTYQAQALELEKMKVKKQELENQNALKIAELERQESQMRLQQYRKSIEQRTQTAQIKLLAKDKALLEQTKRTQQIDLQSQKDREKLLFGLVLVVLAAGGGTYVAFAKVKTTNLMLRVKQDEVVAQKESVEQMFSLLETKNRNITDSIRFARKIQGAVIPGPDALSQVFPLSFVLLRPCDVVSGDVFYLHQTERHVFLASIDCTGHGVPGAMLAVLGYQMLNNIVQGAGLSEPHAILYALDNAMAEVLRVEHSDLQQGMDVGLVVIDRKAKSLAFCGAVHDLIYFEGNQQQSIRGSRCSIGGLVPRHEKVYTTTRIGISHQMQCYLASDGLSSQLGGPSGKRFGSARVSQLYAEIAGLSAVEKKAHIETTLDAWIGAEYKQLDDVLIIGFRPDLVV